MDTLNHFDFFKDKKVFPGLENVHDTKSLDFYRNGQVFPLITNPVEVQSVEPTPQIEEDRRIFFFD